MTSGEIDLLCIDFCVAAGAFTWVGWWLRGRVERHRAEAAITGGARRRRPSPPIIGRDFPIPLPPATGGAVPITSDPRNRPPRPALVPIGKGTPENSAGDTRTVRLSELMKRPIYHPKRPIIYDTIAEPRAALAPAMRAMRDVSAALKDERDEVVAILVNTGYKAADARRAVAECTPLERQTIEGWVAAALRRAAGPAR